jgi:hypothetical protein
MGHDGVAFARALWQWHQIGQFSQEFIVVTSAPGHRVASALVALCLAGPAVLIGGVAWADPSSGPSPDPAAPTVQPSIGTWLVGGTLLEGTAAKPVAQPATKPVAKPAAGTTTTSTGTTSTRTTVVTPAGDATVLPFTGGHLDALLPTGVALLAGGLVLTFVARPRRALA